MDANKDRDLYSIPTITCFADTTEWSGTEL